MSLTNQDDDTIAQRDNSSKQRLTSKQTVSSRIRIATINVRTLQDEIKLATTVKAAQKLEFDILALQETRIISNGLVVFDDESIKGWQLVYSGHKRKRQHGVGILLAPHVKLISYEEHLQARIISATVCVRGMRVAILNVYAPTDASQADSAKSIFFAAMTKAKTNLDLTPKYKVITLGDFNATISAASKDSGSWNDILGSNNPNLRETNNNACNNAC